VDEPPPRANVAKYENGPANTKPNAAYKSQGRVRSKVRPPVLLYIVGPMDSIDQGKHENTKNVGALQENKSAIFRRCFPKKRNKRPAHLHTAPRPKKVMFSWNLVAVAATCSCANQEYQKTQKST